MNPLVQSLTNIGIGQPQIHKNMKVYPLHIRNGHQRDYLTLDEALKAGQFQVQEVNQSGSVPTLTVGNTGKLPVLIIVGEELIGAKQNRALNTSLLIPAESQLEIPVSCIERGRWAYTSARFSSDVTTSHMSLRKAQVEQVTDNLRARGEYMADQSAVWSEVERKISAHSSSSPTRALHDVYVQNEDYLKDYLGAFNVPEDAEGILVEINGEIVGADMFDHHETLNILWPKLVRSYALDALEVQNQDAQETPSSAAQEFLKLVEKAATQPQEYTSVGLGKDLRLKDERVTGSGLLWGERIVHASLFNAKK